MEIIGIHPADKDLNFLKKVNYDLVKRFSGKYEYYRLEPNYQTHEKCIKELYATKVSNLFFFCHALEKSIRGCKITAVSSAILHKDFNYGPLISPEYNIKVFSNKKVFCLACFSRDLGEYAIRSGALVFLGFGDIPFYIRNKYKEAAIEAGVKRELGRIVYDALERFIEQNWTFNHLANYLQASFDRTRYALLSDKSSGVKIRVEISNVLSRIKNGITMFGNGNLRIRD